MRGLMLVARWCYAGMKTKKGLFYFLLLERMGVGVGESEERKEQVLGKT